MIGFDPNKFPTDHNWMPKSIYIITSSLFSIQYYVKCVNCNIEIYHEERIKHNYDLTFKINSSFFVIFRGYYLTAEIGNAYIPSYDKVHSCTEMIIKNIIE